MHLSVKFNLEYTGMFRPQGTQHHMIGCNSLYAWEGTRVVLTTMQDLSMFTLNKKGYCCPGVIVNPNLVVVTGTMPTLYGEVESINPLDDHVLDRFDQVSSRVLCYTDKCFSVYTKSDVFYIQLY